MDELGSATTDLHFQANQIVCLDHQDASLYGEVIQSIAHRKLCWFRPICLVVSQFDRQSEARTIDLQSGVSDLLWPTVLFRPALDTEIIHHLAQLKDKSLGLMDKKSNRHLNRFVQQVWQANQDKF